MENAINRQFYLHQRPAGMPSTSDVRRRDAAIPRPRDGEVLIRNRYFSLDPAIRGWMSDTPSYLPPIPLGQAITSTTLGDVVQSRHPDFREGDVVYGLNAWEDFSAAPGSYLMKVPPENRFPLHYYLSVFGAVGMTSYFGILEAGKPRPGETVLISAAAGAVGSVAGQIAKILGCRVVGLAGTDAKCRWITDDLGFDAAINYRDCGPLTEAIAGACPEGVDVYFDNVGGAILDAALMNPKDHARIVFCGAISGYNAAEPVPGPYNWWQILARSVTVQGFLVSNHVAQFPQGVARMSEWVAAGRIRFQEQIVDGFENTLAAFLTLFDGTNTGKLIVRVVPD